MKFKVIIDSGNYCDALQEGGGKPVLFDTEEAAEMAGRNWVYEMCAIDGDDPDDENCPYQFDVVEAEPEPTEDEQEEAAAAEEQSLDYFNRYIAGDR